jgi:RNA polymerase nonessential primary-like sigma factor
MSTQPVQPKPATTTVDSVRQYLREIGRYPLLTHEQEINYGKQVQRMLQLIEQRDRLTQAWGRTATTAEWATAAELTPSQLQQAINEGDRAKRRLVEANLRLVVSVAKKYQKLNMEMLDLLQEGGIGLQRAAEKFDPTKGYRFSTYSYWWIRQAMTRAISEQSRTVRLPVHMTEKLGKIKKAQRQLSAELGRKATIDEIASLLELKPQQIRDCLSQSRQPISLDVKIGTDQKTELSELLEDDGQTPDEYAMLNCLKEDLNQWMLDLTPQQRQVLRLRYGLIDNQPMTLQQIAEVLKLTRERIRQIEHAAIKRLRQRQDGMGSYLAG